MPRPVRLFVSALTVLPVVLILIALYFGHLTKKKESADLPEKVETGR